MYKYSKQLTILLLSVFIIACGGDTPKKSTTPKKPTKKTVVESKPVKKEEPIKEEVEEVEPEKKEEAQSEPVPPEQLKKAKEIVSSADASDIDAKKLYRLHCTICHGAKGDMKINGAKDLSISKIGLEESVAQIYFGKGLMTPYNNLLSEDQILAVAKYSETLRR